MLVFDGDCGFCTTSVLWLLRRFRHPVEAVPWQRLAREGRLEALGLSENDVRRFAWWLEGGRRYRGHGAVGKALMACGRGWPLLAWPFLVPVLAWPMAAGYRFIARIRGHLPGTTPACRRERWPP
jgi:predicted DCC family thiol-disulfide oxidoreductase YuxK